MVGINRSLKIKYRKMHAPHSHTRTHTRYDTHFIMARIVGINFLYISFGVCVQHKFIMRIHIHTTDCNN